MVFDRSCDHFSHQQLLQMFRLDVVPNLSQVPHVNAVTMHINDQSFKCIVVRLCLRVDFDQIAVRFDQDLFVRVKFSSLRRLLFRIFTEIFLRGLTWSFLRQTSNICVIKTCCKLWDNFGFEPLSCLKRDVSTVVSLNRQSYLFNLEVVCLLVFEIEARITVRAQWHWITFHQLRSHDTIQETAL